MPYKTGYKGLGKLRPKSMQRTAKKSSVPAKQKKFGITLRKKI